MAVVAITVPIVSRKMTLVAAAADRKFELRLASRRYSAASATALHSAVKSVSFVALAQISSGAGGDCANPPEQVAARTATAMRHPPEFRRPFLRMICAASIFRSSLPKFH